MEGSDITNITTPKCIISNLNSYCENKFRENVGEQNLDVRVRKSFQQQVSG
jgi:hypothetical protein